MTRQTLLTTSKVSAFKYMLLNQMSMIAVLRVLLSGYACLEREGQADGVEAQQLQTVQHPSVVPGEHLLEVQPIQHGRLHCTGLSLVLLSCKLLSSCAV